eukprot:Partr_v1_DN28215_c0_g1_i1_m76298 putative The coatomer is a cytosolic protein complex that binds to dilysine motifs and reversibly associates with Golgi non- clathrin-coated vesicles, which further mediate biosynthetic protein transport from the ER, via the Golgi up to the trans Golgi network. Coatomer complex is required for budding from Golgi membranes, and is essential for the retrograde Golgi-to-ER transport of dilysine-tagged proteins (By similarity)
MVNATTTEACWTIVGFEERAEQSSIPALQKALEKGNEQVKIDTMKTVLGLMMNGDPLPQLMMTVIRFVLPSKSKTLKKLLLVYWELCPKHEADGKLKHEMILVCNYIMNDLQSANEYVRGMTLKFLCRVRDAEILESLIPSVRAGLTHRHAYVRRNTIQAIYAISRMHEHLIPDAAELVHEYLLQENDMACRRNGLLMLVNCDVARAVSYVATIYPQIATFDENLKLAVIELVRKDSLLNLAAKGRYIALIVSMLESSSAAVKFEAAAVLMTLTNSSMAMKEVARCYVDLAIKESDNNIKLIVLQRLKDFKRDHPKILAELSMDILRVLSSADVEVCRRAINIVLDILSGRTVTEVVNFLKKELSKTNDPRSEKTAEYRQLLIHAIHQCAAKHPEVASTVIHVLMEFLNESSGTAALDVITFVREVVERNPHLRTNIVESLLGNFMEMKSGKVLRGALWIVGEYCTEIDLIKHAFKAIGESIGELPIVAVEQRLHDEKFSGMETIPSPSTVKADSALANAPGGSTRKKILSDGSYAAEAAISIVSPSATANADNRPPLRHLIMNGDYFLATVLCSTLTKMVLRLCENQSGGNVLNSLRAQAMLIMTSIIRVGQTSFATAIIDEDSMDRINSCLRACANLDVKMMEIFTKYTREVFSKMIQHGDTESAKKNASSKKSNFVPVDQLINFPMIKASGAEVDRNDAIIQDLKRARGASDFKKILTNKLNRIVQLTGFSDPVYAEAFVDVHQYDILLDILIVNQTTETLQNLNVEFGIVGDLKLVERPVPRNMGPQSFHSIKANIKVSSTETGVIFGNIVYDSGSEARVIVLNDIRIDIMDYINPSACPETQFRQMWAEFEWENKIVVNTNITDLKEFLNHILKNTNMGCLTPEAALEGDCGFLAANMYAKSIFGEDAVGNVALEMTENGTIAGHIRIRSKTQGIALSLGDKISATQKSKV